MNGRPSLRISGRLRRIAASVALAAYVVLTLLGSSLVFCHEADGSVAVEWSGADCCAGLDADGAHGDEFAPTAAPASGDANCVQCVDVPAAKLLTSVGASERRASVPKPNLAPSPDAAVVSFERSDHRPAALRAAFSATSPPPRHATLRTVVLRC